MKCVPYVYDWIWQDNFEKEKYYHKYLIEKELEDDPIGRKISNIGGYQTKDNLNHREEYNKLVEIIEQQSIQIHQELELIPEVKFTIINMWGNINWSGHHNSLHQHTNPPSEDRISSSSVISGIYYLQLPESSGKTGFMKHKVNYSNLSMEPSMVKIPEIFLKNYNNKLLKSNYEYEAQEGDLLMFFSDVLHYVSPSNIENNRRITISFNLGLELNK